MAIGSFANIIFEVSDRKVLTYDDYKRESKARYAQHQLINQPAVSEWLGRELEELSFKMTFSVALKVNPKVEVEKLRQLCHDGWADYLIVGTSVIGENLWIIESISEDVKAWDNAGNILLSTVNVKMVEYASEVIL